MGRGGQSIEAKVNVVVVTAALAVGLVGATGWESVAALREDNARLSEMQAVLSAQQEADMLHDELRSDVLSTLTDQSAAEARLNAVRHAAALREQVNRTSIGLARLDLPAVQREHAAAQAALEEFASASVGLAQLSGSDSDAAHTALPGFEDVFGRAREQMGVVTEHLRASADDVRVAAGDRAAAQQRRTGMVVGLALALLAALALGIRRSIQATLVAKSAAEDEIRRVNDQLRDDARDKRFQTTLKDAFDMALGEEDAGEVVRRAVRELVPDRRAELLLVDNSRAHLTPVMDEPAGSASGCPVTSVGECVAVRRGRPVSFGSSEDLASCPKLRGRGTPIGSAVCAPVTFLGEGLGVLHVVSERAELVDAETTDGLRHLAEEAGNRIGTLRAFQRSQLQASTDGLTGLLNRRTADERVRELQRNGGLLTVVLADLDHFKTINDTFGHEAGDRALRVFSSTLRSVLRAEDVVARYGGEEFLLVMPHCGEGPARDVLERLRTELALALISAGVPPFTASFGLTILGPDQPLEDAVRAADHALLQAKAQGRDRVVVDTPLTPAPSRAKVSGTPSQ